jgi:hypothetical protein
MRAEYQLAMRRESSELEKTLIDQRIDQAFEQVYDYLEPAANYLRQTCDGEGLRALEQLERAYQQALEHAARSGIGCGPARGGETIPRQRALVGAVSTDVAGNTGDDTVLLVRPCG